MTATNENPINTTAGACDTRDFSASCAAPEQLAEQLRQAVERGQAEMAARTPQQQIEHENRMLATLLAGSGETFTGEMDDEEGPKPSK